MSFVRDGSIFVASADGSRAVVYLRATRDVRGWQRTYRSPAWSSGGGALAAVEGWEPPAGSEQHGYFRLIVMRNGKTIPLRCCGGEDASWSPDGRRLVHVEVAGWDAGYAEGGLEIGDLSTGVDRTLTQTEKLDGLPAWSPDGETIAFVRSVRRSPDGYTAHLYGIAPAGAGVRRVAAVRAANPNWSPDSRWIAFDDGRRIGVVARSGGRVRFVANGTDPAWSPDGSTIAVVRGKDVWLVDARTRKARLAVRNASQPAWRRRPRP